MQLLQKIERDFREMFLALEGQNLKNNCMQLNFIERMKKNEKLIFRKCLAVFKNNCMQLIFFRKNEKEKVIFRKCLAVFKNNCMQLIFFERVKKKR